MAPRGEGLEKGKTIVLSGFLTFYMMGINEESKFSFLFQNDEVPASIHGNQAIIGEKAALEKKED